MREGEGKVGEAEKQVGERADGSRVFFQVNVVQIPYTTLAARLKFPTSPHTTPYILHSGPATRTLGFLMRLDILGTLLLLARPAVGLWTLPISDVVLSPSSHSWTVSVTRAISRFFFVRFSDEERHGRRPEPRRRGGAGGDQLRLLGAAHGSDGETRVVAAR